MMYLYGTLLDTIGAWALPISACMLMAIGAAAMSVFKDWQWRRYHEACMENMRESRSVAWKLAKQQMQVDAREAVRLYESARAEERKRIAAGL